MVMKHQSESRRMKMVAHLETRSQGDFCGGLLYDLRLIAGSAQVSVPLGDMCEDPKQSTAFTIVTPSLLRAF